MRRLFLATMLFAIMATMVSAESNFHRGRFNSFYYELRPYGYWMEIDNVIVWKPDRVHRNWQPYTYGRWVHTSYGWFWDSDEPFGDIVFHYGRWYYDTWEGWVWVPGYEWAPAWVEWRYDDDYIGWAPLSPYAIFDASYGIRFSINIVIPVHHWRFVRFRDFHRYDIYNFYFTGYGADRCYERTNSFSNYKYRDRVINEGPDPRIVEKRGGGNVKTRDIDFTAAKERGNNSADGRVKVRNIDLNRGDKADTKIEITRTRSNGDLKSDKVDASAREISREVKRTDTSRDTKRNDDSRTVTRDDNRPVTRDNGNSIREVKRDDPGTTSRGNSGTTREVKKDNSGTTSRSNGSSTREVKREDNRPVVRDNTSRETKRDNTVRETPKRDTTPRSTGRSDSGNSGNSGGRSTERKSR
ncbi:MAG: hypothetical protein AMXMBFR49_15690 [Chlorobiota bacterium]